MNSLKRGLLIYGFIRNYEEIMSHHIYSVFKGLVNFLNYFL